MGTLIVDRKGASLKLQRKAITVHENGEYRTSIPLSHIDRIIICNNTQIGTNLLGAAAENGIAFTVIDSRNPQKSSQMYPVKRTDVQRRLNQYVLATAGTNAEQWSAILIRKKLQKQRRLLQNALKQRADKRKYLLTAIQRIADGEKSLKAAKTAETIRGIEGAAARAYFAGYGQLFAPALNFNGRNRRPPRDPVNAILSLSYTMAHKEAVIAIIKAGLDPMLGFYHTPEHSRESLACDLIELIRPDIDKWAWQQFKQKTLRADHFKTDAGGCFLGKAGREQYFPNWEIFARTLRKQLKRYSYIIVRMLQR